MTTKAVVEAIQDIIEALHYHEQITPEGGGEPTPGPEIKYFNHVWIGKPQKIPAASSNIAFVEAANEPEFNYTTCKTHGSKDIEVLITLGSIGSIELATLDIYDKTDKVIDAINGDTTKLAGTCMGSEVQNVIYGELDIGDERRIIAASAITVIVTSGV